MEKILITIIIPVYNVERYVERCIESVLCQTYRNLQVIIINDGSTDETGSICKRIAQADTRVEMYETENKGPAVARKLGLKYARGQYVEFVDGDDYIEPQMVERLLENMLETAADFVHSGYIEESSVATVRKCVSYDAIFNLHTCNNHKDAVVKLCFNGTQDMFMTPSIWSKLYRRSFIEECFRYVPNEQMYGEDVICLVVSLIRSRRISILKEAYYHYVVREKSLSHINGEKLVLSEIDLHYYLKKVLIECNSLEMLKTELCRYIQQRMRRLFEMVSAPNVPVPKFYWRDMERLYNKKVLIYGAGVVGIDYYSQICKYKQCEIVGWADNNWKNIHLDYADIQSIDEMLCEEYDVLLVAVRDEKLSKEIVLQLANKGIPINKILWESPGEY